LESGAGLLNSDDLTEAEEEDEDDEGDGADEVGKIGEEDAERGVEMNAAS
jgi:hypothetical protein